MTDRPPLRVIYRASDSTNQKQRPPYFNKLACLRNFLAALSPIRPASMLMIYDGTMSHRWRRILPEYASVRNVDHLGSSQSFVFALDSALLYPSEDIVYFVEDDYLHVPGSLDKLIECFETINPDYATLYDHPVRYSAFPGVDRDLPIPNARVMTTSSHHWQPVESTCMTFGARVRTLHEDKQVLLTHAVGFQHPRDRELFRHLQGLGKYRDMNPRRRLLGPIPSLATHCEIPWLAPTIDWAPYAGLVQPEQYG